MRIPPAEGPLPEVALSYSSQTVDGRMAGANNQASWAGDGWDYSPGFIERSYVTCDDDRSAVSGNDPNNKDERTSDQCWKGDSPNVTVSLNGTNATLIKDDDVRDVARAERRQLEDRSARQRGVVERRHDRALADHHP